MPGGICGTSPLEVRVFHYVCSDSQLYFPAMHAFIYIAAKVSQADVIASFSTEDPYIYIYIYIYEEYKSQQWLCIHFHVLANITTYAMLEVGHFDAFLFIDKNKDSWERRSGGQLYSHIP